MIGSKEMLQMAKQLFQNCDSTMSAELGGE